MCNINKKLEKFCSKTNVFFIIQENKSEKSGFLLLFIQNTERYNQRKALTCVHKTRKFQKNTFKLHIFGMCLTLVKELGKVRNDF